MKSSNELLLLGMLSALCASAAAADGAGQAPVDTSQWKCESCKFEDGVSGTVDVGVGSVSKKSAKFGEYNGLGKEGGFFIGDGALRSRGTDGDYWNLNGSNLGLDTRSLDAEGGRQGSYKLMLKYDEMRHRISDSVTTPFSGNGGASLTLPGFAKAGTTDAMTSLPGSLQQVDIGTQRKRLGLGASWIAAQDWEYAVNFRHETKEGTKRTAGAFFVNSAQLVEPVDYVTDQMDASASYTGGRLQAKFAYFGSKFKNGNDSLSWDNPYATAAFLGTFPGAARGQLALPPGNQSHQLQASAGYQLSERTRASGDIAWGRMTQNDDLLPYGTAFPGPGGSLNARAATLDANLKLSSALTDKLRLNGVYTHNKRDNQTPQATYAVVSTDMFPGTPRTNLPYSFTQDKLKLSADYRATANTRVSAGVDFDAHKRTYQEAASTREDTVWGKIASRIFETADLTFKLAHAERSNSGYQVVPGGITPPENPLLRKYNMADRTRDTSGLRVDIAAADNINVGVGLDLSKDDYSASSIGLTSGRQFDLNGDVSVIFTPQTSLHLFGGRQEIKSTQAGSQAYSTADWTGENKDTTNFVGIGVKYAAIEDKLDIGADFSVSRSRGEITVISAAPNPAFPNLSASLDSLKLYANYRLKDNVSLIGSYWSDHYDSKNWMLDGVTPSTIPNVLAFGEQPPRYRVNVIRLSLKYRF